MLYKIIAGKYTKPPAHKLFGIVEIEVCAEAGQIAALENATIYNKYNIIQYEIFTVAIHAIFVSITENDTE